MDGDENRSVCFEVSVIGNHRGFVIKWYYVPLKKTGNQLPEHIFHNTGEVDTSGEENSKELVEKFKILKIGSWLLLLKVFQTMVFQIMVSTFCF